MPETYVHPSYRAFTIEGHPHYARTTGVNAVILQLRGDTTLGFATAGATADLAALDVGETIRYWMVEDPNTEERVEVTRTY
jgi:hypothetical protein